MCAAPFCTVLFIHSNQSLFLSLHHPLPAQCMIVCSSLYFQHAPSICIVCGDEEAHFLCEGFVFVTGKSLGEEISGLFICW